MQCEQLIRHMKDWFLHVKNETMAPARMMQFADQHIKKCAICQEDPDIHDEIEKIREFILPESKIPKALRRNSQSPTPEISPNEKTEPAAAPKPVIDSSALWDADTD